MGSNKSLDKTIAAPKFNAQILQFFIFFRKHMNPCPTDLPGTVFTRQCDRNPVSFSMLSKRLKYKVK